MSWTSVAFFFRVVKIRLIPYACPVGIVLNGLLLYLIVNKPIIQEYKKVFLLTCVCDIASCVNGLFFMVTLVVQNERYYAIIEGVLGHLSPAWTLVGYGSMLFFLYSGATNNTVVFMYRYFSVCRNTVLSTMAFLLITLVGWLIVFVYCGAIVFVYIHEPDDPYAYIGLNGTEFPSDGSFTDFISNSIPPIIPVAFFGGIPIATISYMIIIGTSIAVYRKFNKLKELMSPEQRKFHSEVTIVLSMEALTPFLTVALPVYVDISKLVFPDLPSQWFAELSWILTLIGPSMTAIIKLVSIKIFREAVTQAFCGLCSVNGSKTRVVAISGNNA
uniref:G_PROTEIN_RECEP_F1_2 domain-containing protein n=1 Tax=Panagrellus redivivus TaxID=6233 RepID=A0A7E4USW3_PANRE